MILLPRLETMKKDAHGAAWGRSQRRVEGLKVGSWEDETNYKLQNTNYKQITKLQCPKLQAQCHPRIHATLQSGAEAPTDSLTHRLTVQLTH